MSTSAMNSFVQLAADTSLSYQDTFIKVARIIEETGHTPAPSLSMTGYPNMYLNRFIRNLQLLTGLITEFTEAEQKNIMYSFIELLVHAAKNDMLVIILRKPYTSIGFTTFTITYGFDRCYFKVAHYIDATVRPIWFVSQVG